MKLSGDEVPPDNITRMKTILASHMVEDDERLRNLEKPLSEAEVVMALEHQKVQQPLYDVPLRDLFPILCCSRNA